MNESVMQRKVKPIWTAVVCGMASYIDAATIITWGIVLVIYQQTYSITPEQIGILSGTLTFCVAIGALIGGYLGDRLGRRTVFQITMAGVIIGICGMIFASSFAVMAVISAIVGLATGADLPVSLTTIAESSENEKQRGTLVGLSQFFWLAGIIASVVFSMFVGNLGKIGGQIMLAHIGIVSLLILICRFSIPESQLWKAAKLDKSSANTENKGSIGKLFKMPFVAPFIALIAFYGLSNAAYNVLGQYGTYILVNVANIDIATASSAGVITMPVGLIAVFLFMKTVRGKRRSLYFLLGMITVVIGFIIPVILGITFNSYLISMALFMLGNSFAGEAMMKVWSQESFSTNLRSTAQGSIIAIGRFTAAGFAFVVPVIIAANVSILFVIMSALCLVGGLTAYLVFRKKSSHSIIEEETVTINV
ncbi:MAG: MFS transporter [Eubacteriales bacterium]|nr:MFS transporter [Eubacteriales bacterium]